MNNKILEGLLEVNKLQSQRMDEISKRIDIISQRIDILVELNKGKEN